MANSNLIVNANQLTKNFLTITSTADDYAVIANTIGFADNTSVKFVISNNGRSWQVSEFDANESLTTITNSSGVSTEYSKTTQVVSILGDDSVVITTTQYDEDSINIISTDTYIDDKYASVRAMSDVLDMSVIDKINSILGADLNSKKEVAYIKTTYTASSYNYYDYDLDSECPILNY